MRNNLTKKLRASKDTGLEANGRGGMGLLSSIELLKACVLLYLLTKHTAQEDEIRRKEGSRATGRLPSKYKILRKKPNDGKEKNCKLEQLKARPFSSLFRSPFFRCYYSRGIIFIMSSGF